MKQILKSSFLFQSANSFEEFMPEIPHNFYVLASLTIGGEYELGGSDYSLGICTPTWLDHQVQNSGPLSGRHLLVVNRFDAAEVRAAIQKIINQCERESPAETNTMLARFFAWEFEDYQT
jgi:hypothetical protein